MTTIVYAVTFIDGTGRDPVRSVGVGLQDDLSTRVAPKSVLAPGRNDEEIKVKSR